MTDAERALLILVAEEILAHGLGPYDRLAHIADLLQEVRGPAQETWTAERLARAAQRSA